MSSDAKEGLMSFKLLSASVKDGLAARLGRLTMAQRTPVTTPNYFAITSRGSVPHMTPDVLAKYTSLGGAYMALEDCEC
jgi:queuine tRNA-ribosyltransferase accessory subunit